jgi:cysteinyl-tRNA synthetase
MTYPQITLYNTYKKKKEVFEPVQKDRVGIYSCGMTVYSKTHIGHAQMYTSVDFLVRFLKYCGYKVILVRNYTDVGHLTGDNEGDPDKGFDKMEKGAQRYKKSVWEVADMMIEATDSFFDQLNVIDPNFKPRATGEIEKQIEIIKDLIEKGYAYVTKEAVYYDVGKFNDYSYYSGQKLEDKKIAVRDAVESGEHKKHPADFALWFFTVGRFKDHEMRWESPWGVGFPGWHIECSAMSIRYLGNTVDIHTGGEEHIRIHHANEIAQSEAATGEQFVRYWFHNRFLLADGQKMSKSVGNVYDLDDLKAKGYDPMDLRYFFATARYRQRLNFSWQAIEGARRARLKLVKFMNDVDYSKGKVLDEWKQKFTEAVADDINIPKGLSIIWDLISEKSVSDADKVKTILDFDQVLGLKLGQKLDSDDTTDLNSDEEGEIEKMIEERNAAKNAKDYKKADEIRDELSKKFKIKIEDTKEGTVWEKL